MSMPTFPNHPTASTATSAACLRLNPGALASPEQPREEAAQAAGLAGGSRDRRCLVVGARDLSQRFVDVAVAVDLAAGARLHGEDSLHREKRMAAQVEEVVVHAHRGNLQL